MPHDGTARTAELVKLTENAYRDVNIAFANEISLVCDSLGIDPWELIGLANRHPRVDILKPGSGRRRPLHRGRSVVHRALGTGADAADAGRPPSQQRQAAAGSPSRCSPPARASRHPTIACLGLAYKADVGDLRESPAIAVIERSAGRPAPAGFLVVEPHVDELPSGLLAGGRTVLVCLDHALAADVILLLTDHEEFRRVDRRYLAGKRVIDTRGIWRDTAE